MRHAASRLRIGLVLLAWWAQLCLPVAHAAWMSGPPPAMGGGVAGWCGDLRLSTAVQAYLVALPDELRPGVADEGSGAHALAACSTLCALAGTPPPLPLTASATQVLRAAGLEPPPVAPPAPVRAALAPRPPSQGPPGRA